MFSLKEGFKLELSVLKALKYPFSIELVNFIISLVNKYFGEYVSIGSGVLQSSALSVALIAVAGFIFFYDLLKHGFGVKLP